MRSVRNPGLTGPGFFHRALFAIQRQHSIHEMLTDSSIPDFKGVLREGSMLILPAEDSKGLINNSIRLDTKPHIK